MRPNLFISACTAVFMSSSVLAVDCGEPPVEQPDIPAGDTASADDIRDARKRVLDYSGKVDDYLACMDGAANKILPFLTKEQKVRWEQDTADVHNARRDLQIKLNEAIRAYRNAR